MITTAAIDHVERESQSIADVTPSQLDLPVPTVPGWSVRAVIRHTGKVHRWALGILAAGRDADLKTSVPSLSKGDDCLAEYRAVAMELVRYLREHDPNQFAKTFVGERDLAFWARRQAHEIAVHRADVSDAVGREFVIDPEFAADGAREWAELFAAMRHAPVPDGVRGRRLRVEVTNAPVEYVIHFADPQELDEHAPMEVVSRGDGDAIIRGNARDVLLTLHRRRPLSAVSVIGDADLAQQVYEAFRL